MRNILIIGCLFLLSCKKDAEIGAPIPIEVDYVLPQGNASAETNAKIQQLYDNYGSYFLYAFTQKDFEWTQSTSTGASKIDSVVLGDPAYAGDMLNFLDDIWLKFLPETFKKSSGIPYRVLMADTIKQRRSGTGWPPGMEFLYFDYKVVGKSITFAGMNSSLRTLTPAQKLSKKNILTGVIWNYYISSRILDVPAAFYNVSNYAAAAPSTPLNAANPANVEAYRAKGFLPGSYLANGNPSEWHNGTYSWSTARTNDINSFILNLTQRTDAQLQSYLTYPLIKQKYDILVNHYKTKYNIDIRAIGNATY